MMRSSSFLLPSLVLLAIASMTRASAECYKPIACVIPANEVAQNYEDFLGAPTDPNGNVLPVGATPIPNPNAQCRNPGSSMAQESTDTTIKKYEKSNKPCGTVFERANAKAPYVDTGRFCGTPTQPRYKNPCPAPTGF